MSLFGFWSTCLSHLSSEELSEAECISLALKIYLSNMCLVLNQYWLLVILLNSM